MTVTQAQIDAVTDPVQKLALQMQFDGRAVQDAIAANSARQAAAAEACVVTAQEMLEVARSAAGGLLNQRQELWVNLYGLHLKTRLGPAILSSTTLDSVKDSIVKDSARMTDVVFPTIDAALAKLV
jgi:hypothetical protein